MTHHTEDPRVRKIGVQTWIDRNSRYVFEQPAGAAGINAYHFAKGPGQQPPLNPEPYDTLDAAIAAHLGERP